MKQKDLILIGGILLALYVFSTATKTATVTTSTPVILGPVNGPVTATIAAGNGPVYGPDLQPVDVINNSGLGLLGDWGLGGLGIGWSFP